MPKLSRPARQLRRAIEAASLPLPGTGGEGSARTRLQVRGHTLQVSVSFLTLSQVPGRPGRRTLILSAARADGRAATRRDGEALARLLGTRARVWTSGPRVCLPAA